jgi:alcohol dehydrogenase class IV
MAHGVAAALGIHARIAHGLACAVMLPAALRANREVRRAELARLGEAACGRAFACEDDGAKALIDMVEDLCAAVGIPGRLSDLGVRREQIPAIVKSSRGNSMSGNPRDVPDDELTAILEGML